MECRNEEDPCLPSKCLHSAGRGGTDVDTNGHKKEAWMRIIRKIQKGKSIVMGGLRKDSKTKCHLRMDRVLTSRSGG